MTKKLIAICTGLALVPVALADFAEDFDDVGTLPGWDMVNMSEALGLTDWFQGNIDVFGPHATDGYIAANFENAGDGPGEDTISNWLFTPVVTLNNGDELRFWTRSTEFVDFPDRLEVRLSTAGDSTDVGDGATTVGVFDWELLTINPDLEGDGYPSEWTEYVLTVSGLGAPVDGRFAFRYFVEDAGPSGINGDYIGIDTVSYTAIPEPASLGLVVLGLLSGWRRR